MYIHLDHHSGEPIYRQIVEAIKYKVASGELELDERLPSIRNLADQLQINPRTVVKVYEELEHNGLVVLKHGQGVFVAINHGLTPASARKAAIADLARRLLAEASRLGASGQDVMDIMRDEAARMEQKK